MNFERVAILGAGSIGTILGAMLAKKGIDVDLIDSYKAHVDALNEKGATVVGGLNFTVPVKAYMTEEISGVPSSFPGETLTEGSRGEAVRQIQQQLNAIADVYYSIPNLAADGVYGPRTAETVRAFQQQFSLNPSGIIDFTTWYKISEIYVAVTRIAEYTR